MMAKSTEHEHAATRMAERKRLSHDDIEEMINELYEWMTHMKRMNPQFVMPHTTSPLIDEEGRADLNRAPAAHDSRRRD